MPTNKKSQTESKNDALESAIDEMIRKSIAEASATKIVNLEEYTKEPKVFSNLQKVETEKVKEKGWDNYFSADATIDSDGNKEKVFFFIPQSLMTRIINLCSKYTCKADKLILLVRCNGRVQSNKSKKEYISFYSVCLNENDL